MPNSQNIFDNAFFRHTWRKYQKQVLDELETHLHDARLHIVAAPGSGKTLLGLEVMIRINKPTLVLAPSIAIRNQWAVRFQKDFLDKEMLPDWISFDVKNPKLLTIATYQGLHAAFSDVKNDAQEDAVIEEENEATVDDTEEFTNTKADIIIGEFVKQQIGTIIIDEAHHLRNAWWNSLLYLKEHIPAAHMVSLTATPPYDVSPQEWKNYEALCGPVDAEVSVPELVLEKNLCPHQDFAYFNALSEEESAIVQNFRSNVREFRLNLLQNKEFAHVLLNHPHVLNPDAHQEIIFSNPEYYVSIISYFREANIPIPWNFHSMMTSSTGGIQSFSLQFTEILLEHIIYRDQYVTSTHKKLVDSIRKGLQEFGGIEKRAVVLTDNLETKRLSSESINKMNSILDIVKAEHKNLGSALRMVILTDFIRKESTKLGVVPIFERIRKSFAGSRKIGVLSGSLIVIPASAKEKLQEITKDVSFTALETDPEYLEVAIRAKNDTIVHSITELFNAGYIEILVGTKSLLGEGWDAPTINSLVLASFVGSFMLSNQMRGRAIRIDKQNPGKVSNIWHLISIENGDEEAGYDFEILQRRFKAFVGLSHSGQTIENGLDRLNLGYPPFNEAYIEAKNTETVLVASEREVTRNNWIATLEKGSIQKMIHEIKTKRKSLPKKFVLYNTLYALFWRSFAVGLYFFIENFRLVEKVFNSIASYDAQLLLAVVFVVPLLISIPAFCKTLWLFLKNGSIENNMQRVAEVVVKSLIFNSTVKTPFEKLQILTTKNPDGTISCGLKGATVYEESVFIDCLEEITNPIQNPRYILTRHSRFNFFLRNDYHAVPEILATKKTVAVYFSKLWSKLIGSNKLIYTRNHVGRMLLLKARKNALSTQFQKKSERVEIWK